MLHFAAAATLSLPIRWMCEQCARTSSGYSASFYIIRVCFNTFNERRLTDRCRHCVLRKAPTHPTKCRHVTERAGRAARKPHTLSTYYIRTIANQIIIQQIKIQIMHVES